ncbi:hypothetical protein D027_1803, partial [Vibrio parahaemolyticus 861]
LACLAPFSMDLGCHPPLLGSHRSSPSLLLQVGSLNHALRSNGCFSRHLAQATLAQNPNRCLFLDAKYLRDQNQSQRF